MPPFLQTARLSFRDFTVDDYDNVHVYASDPEVTRYTAFGPNTPYSLGYVLHKDWWRQGLVSEATAELMKFGFGELRAHRLWAHVFLGNTGSEKVLQKLGFRYEGCKLKSFFVRNTWFDLQPFAMLKREWERRAA